MSCCRSVLGCVLIALAAVTTGQNLSEEYELSGVESWAWRKAYPALVNPTVASPLQEVISLRGEWEFVTTPRIRPYRHPTWDAFYAKPWQEVRTIQVPGCWEAQGVGEPGMSDSWDPKWDHCAKPLRHIYNGVAWYRKEVELPTAWQGKRIWLKVGGVRSHGWFWVNNKAVAWVDNYCGCYKYDITDLVEAGKPVKVVVEVNNKLPSRKGEIAAVHRFGGLYRDVELEATPDSRIDDAWVRGDFDKQEAEVRATIVASTLSGRLKSPILRVKIRETGATAEAPVTFGAEQKSCEAVVRLPLKPFKPWSPETPNLYVADLTLCDGETAVHGWSERFGVRKIEVRGDRFFLNNQPFFVRGFGDDYVYPITLCSPASKEAHLKHLLTARAAGFNYVRKHTHTDVPEYYEAADEAGIMIQPELPYYGDEPVEAFTFDPIRDIKELYYHYRRYVSFTTYCTGNEGLLGKPLDRQIYQLIKRLDPDRLAIHQDGTFNDPTNSDFCNGPINVWAPGSFKSEVPFIAHEYLNLSVKQDPRLESQFSGAYQPPVTLAKRDAWLEEAGLNRRWGDALQDAMHGLQAYYQKRGVESARLDPTCDGYSFWTIVDVIVEQGKTYSAQGLFDGFWQSKRNGLTAEEFKLFNGPSALLLKKGDEEWVAQSGDTLSGDIWLAYYGTAPLTQAQIVWSLKAGDETLAQGEVHGGAVALGDTKQLGVLAIKVPQLTKPVAAVLELKLSGSEVCNRWNYWLFPTIKPLEGSRIAVTPAYQEALAKVFTNLCVTDTAVAADAELVITRYGTSEMAAALAAGKRLLLINQAGGKPNISLGWWWMGSQVGTAIARHPALGEFPHAGFLSPLLFRIIKQGRPLPIAGILSEEMIVVGEGGNAYYLYMAQSRIGVSPVVVTFGLDLLADKPEAAYLLQSLVNYMLSDRFEPKGEIKEQVSSSNQGWQSTQQCGDSGHTDLPVGVIQMDIARGTKDKNVLAWRSHPVEANAHEKPQYTIQWIGGMGYPQQAQADFQLFVNGEAAVHIKQLSWQDAEWHSPDRSYILRYQRDPTTNEAGNFTLTMPSNKVKPGEAIEFRFVGSASNSLRWVGVAQTW